MNIPYELQMKIEALLSQGQRLQAVKLLTMETGCGLKEARDFVDGMGPVAPPVDTIILTNVEDQLISLLQQGKKLEAIKLYRDHTGLGLKESKDYIESLEADKLLMVTGSAAYTSVDDILAHQGNKKKGCFVATACYGNYDAPEVLVLRHFRDSRLMTSGTGRLLVKLYYFLSPPIARQLDQSHRVRSWVRNYLLQPLVRKIQCRKG